MQLAILVFAPALAALILLLLPHKWLARGAIIIPAALFATFLIDRPELVSADIPWIPSLGISISFFIDGLGALFALIITGIGTLVLLYASGYFDGDADYVRFSGYTLLFMTAMLGIVLSGNLLMLFVFWEITSISSYLLIGFKHEKDAAREGARRALLVTASGGLAMLAGFLLIGITVETFDLRAILSSGEILRDSPLYSAIVLLVLAGAFTKSAQWPFHFWLPGAMEAPTPASTYLHSATMVKAGIFLIARLSPILNDTTLWIYLVTGTGLITFLYAAVIALRQTDLKAILAYSTVSWLGALVALQGPNSEYAAIALTTGILGHALYKGALFLVAGNIDHATGTRDINRLGRLSRAMPLTFVGALIAGLSMAGIPPLLGFLSKETLKAAALIEGLPPFFSFAFPAAAILGSALTVAVAFRVVWDSFLGNRHAETPHHPHEVSLPLWIGPLTLGIFSVGLPLLTASALDPLIDAAVEAIRQQPASVHLHLFEGITTPLLMSAVAIVLGLIIFMLRGRIGSWLQARRELNTVAAYNWVFKRALPATAEGVTSRLQTGKLRYDMRIVLAAFIGFTALTLVAGGVSFNGPSVTSAFDWRAGLVCLLLIVGAIAVTFTPSRLGAVAVLGIEGALLSLLFALFGAPDLAFTQLMIEVITIVLFVLAFHFLPDAFIAVAPMRSRLLDILIAGGAGVVVTLLILAARTSPIAESISPWYIENAVAIGQGHNVVNVILVDFRGLDTQGEISVLVIAAMGVTALLRLRPPGAKRGQYLSAETEARKAEQAEASTESEAS